MRYTLKKLKALVPSVLEAGNVNTPYEGYPILHSVFIELRDETDNSKHPQYLKLIDTILQHPGCNSDVLDKHQKPLLVYAGESDKLAVVKMLLRSGADPNLTSTILQYTALEWLIQRNPTSNCALLLSQYTTKTPQLLHNCQEMFDTALEEDEIDAINTLLDLKLVTYTPKFRTNLSGAPNLPKGFWIRTISDPKSEFQILLTRQNLEDNTLAKQRHTHKPDANSHYTNYSPATYVRHSIPISTFGFQDAAVMIHPTNDPIPYWYDGEHEELTREFSYHKGAKLSNGRLKGQQWEVTPQQIQKTLEDLYKKQVQQYRQTVKEDKNEEQRSFDNHGVMLDRQLCDIHFSWNEGLMRYKHKQIFGILVSPESKSSCIKAFELQQTLQLNVPFYQYCTDLGTTQEINPRTLIQKWNIGIPVVATEKTVPKPIILSNGHQLPERKQHTATSVTLSKVGIKY